MQVHIVPGIADHEAAFLESSLRPIKAKAASRKVYQYKIADFERFKVSKGAKIRNRYNQVPHLTQDTNGKVTNSQ